MDYLSEELEAEFGGYAGTHVDVEVTSRDLDVERAEQERDKWLAYAEEHSGRLIDRRLGTHMAFKATLRIAVMKERVPERHQIGWIDVTRGIRVPCVRYELLRWRE